MIRADRADGVVLRNFKVELSDFNNIYVLETNGFRIDRVESGYSREYGILSFTSDHGIYENCETYGNGDSGVYPGSGPDRHGLPDAHGHVYGIVIRNCNSHDNNIGSSGTAGNGTLFHNNQFHDNAIGVTTDSFAGGHPGQPQDASKWTDNLIYSNNKNIFSDDRDAYCKQPAEDRDPTVVCPTFQVPVGTGMLIAGGNDNIVEGNYIFDNWRRGTMLHWVPSSFRGEPDPAKGFDTSNNNAYVDNCMGIRPPNLRAPDYSSCQGIARRERRRLLVGRGGGPGLRARPARLRRHRDREDELLERQHRPERRAAHLRSRAAAGMPRLRHRVVHVPERRTSCSSCCRARAGTRRPTRTRPGATGSRRRLSRTRCRVRERLACGVEA